jgi:hypothetical protein
METKNVKPAVSRLIAALIASVALAMGSQAPAATIQVFSNDLAGWTAAAGGRSSAKRSLISHGNCRARVAAADRDCTGRPRRPVASAKG